MSRKATPKNSKKAHPNGRLKHDPEAHGAVYGRIRSALLTGRFLPGQKLQEPAIARALGTSRERVRGALRQLAFERLLTLTPNRGTFVPSPSSAQITEVVEARITVESAVVRNLAEDPAKFDLTKLDRHIEKEAIAAGQRRRAKQIELSAQFHVCLCEAAGNRFVLGFQKEIIGISQLYYALYGPAEFPHCGGPDEHPAIMAAIRAGKGDRAARLIARHLRDSLQHTVQRKLAAEFQGLEQAFAPVADVSFLPRDLVHNSR
jgi:DNA-binding GntR family transcriptional regulator